MGAGGGGRPGSPGRRRVMSSEGDKEKDETGVLVVDHETGEVFRDGQLIGMVARFVAHGTDWEGDPAAVDINFHRELKVQNIIFASDPVKNAMEVDQRENGTPGAV